MKEAEEIAKKLGKGAKALTSMKKKPVTPMKTDSHRSKEKDYRHNPVVSVPAESKESKEREVMKQPRRAQWRIPSRRESSGNQLNLEAGISVYQRTANNSIHRNFESPNQNIDYRNANQSRQMPTLNSFQKRAFSIGQKPKPSDPSSDENSSKEMTVYCVLRE